MRVYNPDFAEAARTGRTLAENPELQAIERRRIAMGVTVAALERAAVMAHCHYMKLRNGDRKPLRSTIARLSLALDNIRRKRDVANRQDYALGVAYRLAIIVAAGQLGHDPAQAQAADHGRRATQDPAWMRSAEVRRLAIYLLVSECGFTQAEVARAAGMSRQNASDACHNIEDLRDEGSAFERMVDTLRLWIMGEAA